MLEKAGIKQPSVKCTDLPLRQEALTDEMMTEVYGGGLFSGLWNGLTWVGQQIYDGIEWFYDQTEKAVEFAVWAATAYIIWTDISDGS